MWIYRILLQMQLILPSKQID